MDKTEIKLKKFNKWKKDPRKNDEKEWENTVEFRDKEKFKWRENGIV